MTICSICGAHLEGNETKVTQYSPRKAHDHRCLMDVLEDILLEIKRNAIEARG